MIRIYENKKKICKRLLITYHFFLRPAKKEPSEEKTSNGCRPTKRLTKKAESKG